MEPSNYLDYMLTENDFSIVKAHNITPVDKWIPVNVRFRPADNERVWVCGYCYPGIIEYTDGIYQRSTGEFMTKFDYMENVPEFKVLYFRGIERIPDVECEI